ncbi:MULTISPECIES: YeeE/YedE family protein [Vibrio]|uniref:YeeE/YedE family protein n=1 Tax=Vibrio ponticus TaxID=265668 RepID=A0A3N3DVK3_9VIBR|nr:MULTISPECIES: YeeE/YedE family protein [Vibrio]ROV58450.1 YeeE/YedE family protein [Vibrio ponticus]
MIDAIPWNALIGGMLLGCSATLLLLFNGKVAGISGIVNGLFARVRGDVAWRLVFVIGMVFGGGSAIRLFSINVPDTQNISLVAFAVAGLLVGVGTRLGNGCTSGHGICGIGRLSKRSIVATVTFMLVAGITVFIRLHVI